MIPITKPSLGEEEAAAARELVLSGWVTQGPMVKEFEDAFASYVGSEYACAVSNCTTALHLALLAVGVKPGDVVITVSHSFIATANAIRHCGAEPLFVDIDSNTFNLSPCFLEECLSQDCEVRDGQLFYLHVSELAVGESPLRYLKNRETSDQSPLGRVAAVMPVHQMGMPCDLSSVLHLARKFNLPVVEDAACAAGSETHIDGMWEKIGKPHGDVACFSFHPRKIITTGDGGMITTSNSDYDKRFRLLRQHGMSVPDTVRHGSKKVIFEEYVTTGFNYRMTDIQAAVGIEQLKKLPTIVKERRKIASLYHEELSHISWVKRPHEPSYGKTNWQSYPIRILNDAPWRRDEIMQRMLDAGFASRRGIMNAHQELPYKERQWSLPESESARDQVILLPLFPGIGPGTVKDISRMFRMA